MASVRQRQEPARLPDRYRAALDYLFPRLTQIKFGLETTHRLLEALGEPQAQFSTIHVGGTNGKGSVSTLIAAALRAAGRRVGLYTSPHLVSFRERIMVDGVSISRDAVVEWTEHLRQTMDTTGATFFEATTAMAFADFAARGVEIAVLEVGLGGRLDSTNIVTPLVSGITHIAIDHQKYLGDTIEEIAREKAGIAKPGVPFVIGEPDPHLAELLRDAGARVVGDGDYQPAMVPPDLEWVGPLALTGPHQRRNAAVARAMLDALPLPLRPSLAELEMGFGTARLAGRLDRRGKWLYDVAHNPDGVQALSAALKASPPPGPLHAVVSILGDKPWAEMLVLLDQVIDRGVLTVAPSAAARGWDTSWLQAWLADKNRPPARAHWHLEPDFDAALRDAERGAGTVLVTGSFHTVGDVLARRGGVV